MRQRGDPPRMAPRCRVQDWCEIGGGRLDEAYAALAAVVADVHAMGRGEVPEAREPDDQEDEEAVRDDVVEQRVRKEALSVRCW